jgi:hypothetical protein
MVSGSGVLAHIGVQGTAPLIAMGLFFAAIGAAYGAYWLFNHPSGALRRVTAISLGVVAIGGFGAATAFPFLLGAHPSFGRPSTAAHLQILSPRSNEIIRGDPATVLVKLRLEGGTIVPTTSLRLVPDEGHIHLYLDGSLVSMTGELDTPITASPGQHEILAEFVAIDHAPFQPRVRAMVTFSVNG